MMGLEAQKTPHECKLLRSPKKSPMKFPENITTQSKGKKNRRALTVNVTEFPS